MQVSGSVEELNETEEFQELKLRLMEAVRYGPPQYSSLFQETRSRIIELEKALNGPSADQIGPRAHAKMVCTGCPSLETKDWREPDGDGGYDRGTYAWCKSAERRSMGAYYASNEAVPTWCPARAALQSSPDGMGAE